MSDRRSALRERPDIDVGRRAATVKGLALVIGVVYTLAGAVGFVVTGPGISAEPTGQHLLGFEVYPLLNFVHVLVGAAGSVLSRTLVTARGFGWLILVGYAAAFVWASVSQGLTWTSFDWAENWLRLMTVVVAVVVVLLPTRRGVDGL